VTETRLTYRFGPLERRGLLGPVRAGQAVCIAVGMLLAVAALDEAPSASGAALAVALFGAAAGIAVAPVGSRTVEQWAPVACAFALRRLTRRTTELSAMPMVGIRGRQRLGSTFASSRRPTGTARSVRSPSARGAG
jgi:hypothetical protein